jgi:hypothetical protein
MSCLRVLVWAAILGFLFISAGCVDRLFVPEGTVIYPHITPVNERNSTVIPERSFQFDSLVIDLRIPVDSGVFHGAVAASKDITVYGNISESVWIPEALRHIINDPAQEQFYRSLTGAFRDIRDRNSLDDDEYLELMAVFTQSLKYEIRNRTDPKFPIETYVDGSGDCDDKSLLLAGLLSREGYRVALLLFGPESHMAVGVGDGTSGYEGTGYAYLETTAPYFVGVAPDLLRGDVVLRSRPSVIPVGNGTKLYTRTSETGFLWAMLKKTEIRAHELQGEISARERSLSAEKAELDRKNLELSDLLAAGKYDLYNSGVADYNSRVSSYNRNLGAYRTLSDEYDRTVGIHNYILTHRFDRKGTYAWILQHTGE